MACNGVAGEAEEQKQLEWKVFRFFYLSSVKGYFCKSPSFMFDNTSFHLRIYPGGDCSAAYGSVSLFLVNESVCPAHVACTFHVKKADGSLTAGVGSLGINSSRYILFRPFVARGYKDFYNRSDLVKDESELVPSGNLTIVCIMKIRKDEKEVLVKADKQTQTTLEYQRFTELDILSQNLRELFTDEDSCDVVLKVDDKEFKAHRAILMARSHVFSAMFLHDTVEKQTGIVKISDCDSDSFQEFLDYLYSGKLQKISFPSAFHLYSTSKKYDVQELKEFCLEYLKENLAIDNICDVVILADMHDETKLMTKIQDFFNKHWNKIFPTSEWQSLMRDHLSIATKILTELSKAKNS